MNRTLPIPSRLTAVAAVAACAAGLGLFAPAAWGFGFGEPQVSSGLGQPLRLRIPLRVDPDGELTAQCVRLVAGTGSDGIPTMTAAMARISIERKGEGRILRIDSVYPINEPVLRVSVEAGCAQHARREFVLLLDPPDTLPQLAVSAPSTFASASTASAVSTAASTAASTASSPSAVGSSSTAPAVEPASSLATGNDVNPGGTGAAAGAAALELGAATVSGRVGQALSLQVPVTGTEAATLDASCVRLAGSWSGDGPPVLSQAKLAVVRTAAGTQIDVLTNNAVTVPALRVVLEAGCGVPVRREYAVSLDGTAAPAGLTDAAPLGAARPEPATAAAATAEAAPAAAPAPVASGAADTLRRPHKSLPPPVTREPPGAAPAQSPAIAATGATAPGGKATAVQRPKAPAADRLVLASPPDQPDPAAERIAEMDKRIVDLTRELELLRTEMAADRQRVATAVESPQRLSTGWIVAILALLGLGISGLMNLQRKRAGMPWEKPSWEPEPPAMPNALGRASAGSLQPTAPMAARAAAPAAPMSTPAAPARAAAPKAPPPLPRTGPLAKFEELTGTTSTLTPDPGSPQTRIEVTELHADDPELGKMHTVFLEPGNLDEPTRKPADALETRIPGPLPVPGKVPAGAATAATPTVAPAASPTKSSPLAPRNDAPAVAPTVAPFLASLPPVVDLPPLPSPTVVAPEHRHGEFSFDEGPYTQTPTMLALDLDLTTRAVPPEDVEIAKFTEATQKLKEKAAAENAPISPGEPRNGFKNGH